MVHAFFFANTLTNWVLLLCCSLLHSVHGEISDAMPFYTNTLTTRLLVLLAMLCVACWWPSVLCPQVNVIQSLLGAILALRPLPPLPVDLLGALAVGFNAWHTVIPAMEHQVCGGTVYHQSRPRCLVVVAC